MGMPKIMLTHTDFPTQALPCSGLWV